MTEEEREELFLQLQAELDEIDDFNEESDNQQWLLDLARLVDNELKRPSRNVELHTTKYSNFMVALHLAQKIAKYVDGTITPVVIVPKDVAVDIEINCDLFCLDTQKIKAEFQALCFLADYFTVETTTDHKIHLQFTFLHLYHRKRMD